jgi:hypothetical protein
MIASHQASSMIKITPRFAAQLSRLNQIAFGVAVTCATIMLASIMKVPVPRDACEFLASGGPLLFIPYFLTSTLKPISEVTVNRAYRSCLAAGLGTLGFVLAVLMEIFVVPHSSTASIAMIFLPFIAPVLAVILFVIHWVLMAIWGTEVDYDKGSAHCKTCGYDLTGNLSGICPECGIQIAPSPAVNKT